MSLIITAGLGLKPEHFEEAFASNASGLWFEVHPENYFIPGGPRLKWLQQIRTQHPISLHGVGLSLAADATPNLNYLKQLKTLIEEIQPILVSEHLAWSMWQNIYYPDLLPIPRTNQALQRIIDNIERTQAFLKRTIAIENPSHYLQLPHDWDEIDFLKEIAKRSGCNLLLDVNNVYVSAHNLNYNPFDYIHRFPAQYISEIHLAGHSNDPNLGKGLLIDSHDTPINQAVWDLYFSLINHIGPRPTLIERDGNLPSFGSLLNERDIAHSKLCAPTTEEALS
jgi:uncharacterized protein (UPF0276 family)